MGRNPLILGVASIHSRKILYFVLFYTDLSNLRTINMGKYIEGLVTDNNLKKWADYEIHIPVRR